MRARALLLAVALNLAFPTGAAGCSRGFCIDSGSISVASARGVAARPAPRPAPTRPPGTHVVNRIHAGDVVTTKGSTTSIATRSSVQIPGTVARRVSSAGTGRSTGFEGRALNSRLALPDGRLAAADVYQTFVLTGRGWVHANYTFWHDDSLTRIVAPPPPPPTPPPATPRPAPVVTPRPVVLVAPVAPPPPSVTPRPNVAPRVPTPVATPVPRTVRAGIALGPQGDVLDRAEVLRGRRIAFWPRAFVDGIGAPVVSWRFLGGEATVHGATSGTGDEPLIASWGRPTASGIAWTLRFSVMVGVAGEGQRAVPAEIAVAVRSPALVD